MSNKYDPKQIQALTQRELIRQRPGLFIGGRDRRALHQMVYQVLANVLDEAMNGLCSHIWITLLPDNVVKIQDNSPGLSVDAISEAGREMLEIIMTTSVRWKVRFPPDHYRVSGGLYGVGLGAVNLLSSHCTAEVAHVGFIWRQSYREGVPQTPVEKIRPMNPDESTGTTITFQPDFTIFQPNTFDFDLIAQRCQECTYQISGLTMTLRDERETTIREKTFFAPEGLVSWIKALNAGKTAVHPPIYIHQEITARNRQYEEVNMLIELAFQYVESDEITEIAYLNIVHTLQSGTHLDGLHAGIRKMMKKHSPKVRYWRDIAPGFTVIMNIRHSDPTFENAIKTKLMNPEVKNAVEKVVIAALKQQPQIVEAIAHRFTL